jgi:hypothetical protein
VPRHPPNALTSLTTENCPSQAPRLSAELPRPVATFVARRQVAKSSVYNRRIVIQAHNLDMDTDPRRWTPLDHRMKRRCLDETSRLERFRTITVLARASFIYSIVSIDRGAARSWHTRWARKDLNFRPHAYQACALTN